MKKKKVAIVGTNGIPARYGGFETLAENLTKELNKEFDFIVYCSKIQKPKLKRYNNSKLINLPLKANGWQAIMYDIISLLHAWIFTDIILILGPSAGFVLSLNKIFRKKIIVNHGGLNEWERKKLNVFQSKLSYYNHSVASKIAKHKIADNSILAESLKLNFGSNPIVIRYGGDHVQLNNKQDFYTKYPFIKNKYAISVSRAQIDNNLHLVLDAFEEIHSIPLVLISNWQISSYGQDLKNRYKDTKNIILLDAIYDTNELNALRSNAYIYIHSHSQCGTAPSLVEAMSLGLAVVSFDVATNRETTQNQAIYFSNSDDLKNTIKSISDIQIEKNSKNMKEIAEIEYTWDRIANQYKQLFYY